jgi:hypothetical protein
MSSVDRIEIQGFYYVPERARFDPKGAYDLDDRPGIAKCHLP